MNGGAKQIAHRKMRNSVDCRSQIYFAFMCQQKKNRIKRNEYFALFCNYKMVSNCHTRKHDNLPIFCDSLQQKEKLTNTHFFEINMREAGSMLLSFVTYRSSSQTQFLHRFAGKYSCFHLGSHYIHFFLYILD